MITGEKLSVAERLITAACFFIPIVGASFVRESGQGIVKFIGKHWDEAVQFVSKYTDDFVGLLSKYTDDVLMYVAKKGDEGLTLLKKVFNFGDEIALAGGGTVKLEPEASTKLQDFVSRSITKVDDVTSSGAIKGVSNNTGRLIPGSPGVVTGGDSTKLGKNIMESMGLKRSTKWTGHQAQHIIPAEMADNPIIQKIGMDLDNATNGILLRTPDAELSALSRH